MEDINMDETLKEILESQHLKLIGLDDTFQFKCRGCGKCCKEREDIILNPRDIFRIAKYLNLSHEQLIVKFCDRYIGSDSRMPIIRLKPRGVNRVCPFLEGKKCRVHFVKPAVCALYPIGRMVQASNTEPFDPDQDIVVGYTINPADCGSITKTHTVRSWLTRFGIPVKDEFFSAWNKMILSLSMDLRKLEEQSEVTDRVMDMIWSSCYFALYLDYDAKKEFLPQFKENSRKLKTVIEEIKSALLDFRTMPSNLENKQEGLDS